METFAEFQRRRNSGFYSSKGGRIYSSFRTFAHSLKFAEANAVEFARRAPRKGKLRVYEIGVGDGKFALNFLRALRKADEKVAERTTYILWDFSEKGVELASGKLEGFDFETVAAPAWDWKKMRGATCVKCSELLDDLPTRMLVRRGMHVMEIVREGDEFREVDARVEGETALFMEGMPEGYWVPVPEIGLECILGWKGKLAPGGWIDIFDYGFADAEGMRMLPRNGWNASIWREFSGQVTVDVNFQFLKRCAGGRIEAQKDYVERALGKDLWEVDAGKLDYYSYEEVKKNWKKLEAGGYDINILLSGGESSDYLHMEISK
ncbi:MAG: SAM-dependent methyltransferase [Candidatus ainarchaeum sp.]|nr:SAM-dependent methyltransferase [Candidatus ainarchaeum sp.]MDD5096661.1 SAM-dependent methyltransferase [Candidatus ainarchaeum sp.]